MGSAPPGKRPSTCLDVKGTEYIPSVTQDQKDLGIKYFLKYFLGFGHGVSQEQSFKFWLSV